MPTPASSLRQKLTGVLPPITMPFDREGNLVKGGLKEQIDFIIGHGARAVVAGGSTGEGHTLTEGEFDSAMREAYEATAGRVPFVAGLIVQTTRDAIERTRRLKGLNIAALQVTPVHYLFKPDADATVEHFREIYDASDPYPIRISTTDGIDTDTSSLKVRVRSYDAEGKELSDETLHPVVAG